MAGNDTAALVVALSAQLTKFEKDMQGAVAIADKRTKEIETRFTALNKEISGQLSGVAANAAGQIGAIGSILTRLGPIGFAVAVGIGATVGAIAALVEKTNEFAVKAKALSEGADTIGVTITQLKLLGQAGQRAGLDFEQTVGFFSKFVANLEALRGGSGTLYDALLKIDVELLRQLSVTKDSAQAINLLVAAYAKLTDQTKRLDLGKAAGGKTGIEGTRALDVLVARGGLGSDLPGFDEDQIKRARDLKREIDEISKKVSNIWGGMFSDAILEQQKRSAQIVYDLSVWLGNVVGKAKDYRAILNEIGTSAPINTNPASDFFGGGSGAKKPGEPPKPPVVASPSVDLAILQKNLALLGDAVTQGEQWKQKRLEIAAAAEKGGVADGVAQRALAAFNLAQRAAALATRERLAIATEQQIVDVRLAQLAQDQVKFKLSDVEVERARVVILRESKEAADALTVRQAYLPGLKQLQLDAQSTRKALDTLAVNSLNNLEGALVDVVSGTKTASDAFKAMANAIIADIARIAIRQSIIGPLAGLIGGAGSSGLFNVFGAGGFSPTARASGGPVNPGQVYMVGENGPEPFVPQTPGTILPNGSLGGTNISITSHVDARGSTLSPAQLGAILDRRDRNLMSTVKSYIPSRMTQLDQLGA